MHDMGIAFDHELFDHLDRTRFGDPADVVAAKIQQHQVLGPLLWIAQQFLGQGFIFLRRGAARAGAGQWPQGDHVVTQAHQNFRAGADNRKIAEIEAEQKRRRIEPA